MPPIWQLLRGLRLAQIYPAWDRISYEVTWDPAPSSSLFTETNKLGLQIPPTEPPHSGHFTLSNITQGALSFFLFHCSIQMTCRLGVDPEWWHLSWKAADLYSAKLLEASCHRDERKQREAQDLESTFCSHRITNSEKVWRNYSNCRGICNYYKSSQPTKAMLSTLHEVHWKPWEQKWNHVWAHFLSTASAQYVLL